MFQIRFGATTCGLCCYAPFLGSWTYRPPALQADGWGEALVIKANAPALLAAYLAKARPAH
jgi:hypothetical protein